VIYFHQGEDRLAQRLAVIAEETWRALQQPLAVAPPRRTHVVLADQTDLANGYATPLPYDTIVLYTVWPPGADFNVEDWLRLVLTHEFTHIVHLDRSEGWARAVRSIFGRTPIAFPNLFLPAWQIEGLATYEESAITGSGRLHAGDFRAIVEEAAREERLEPLDRTNGGLTDWPGGTSRVCVRGGLSSIPGRSLRAGEARGARRVHGETRPVHRVASVQGGLRRIARLALAVFSGERHRAGGGGTAGVARCQHYASHPSGLLCPRATIRSLPVRRLPGRAALLGQ
jgi:hypothetical protein